MGGKGKSSERAKIVSHQLRLIFVSDEGGQNENSNTNLCYYFFSDSLS